MRPTVPWRKGSKESKKDKEGMGEGERKKGREGERGRKRRWKEELETNILGDHG